MQAALERGWNLRAQSASPGADFEDAQSASLRERAGGGLHGSGNGAKPMAGKQTVTVKLVEQFGARAGEQHLHGILFAAQDRPELGTISSHELRFRKMTGVLRDELALRLVSGFSGGRERRVRSIAEST